MPETALPIITAKDPFAVIAADGIDFVFTACDVANGNDFVSTGRELILVQNSGAAPYTVTVTSVLDEKNRTGDVGPYTLAAGEFACITAGLTLLRGWRQSTSKIKISASNIAVKFAIIKLPI
jgi:hypothetical protein